MASVLSFWRDNRTFFEEKGVQQIIALCGDGRLRDHGPTSIEFRELLAHLPSGLLARFAEESLQSGFDNSGFALQDIVNEVGTRLGFAVEHGLYRGRANEIGFDGIWTATDGFKIVTEVKTTDTYRINLDTLAAYRAGLVRQERLTQGRSSILIVVGRQDTGDLEAQIRGSRHAWDIRLISVESLLKLMVIKESLSDTGTAQQIAEVLKPLEYTRVDRLIDMMFRTSEDLQAEVPASAYEEDPASVASGEPKSQPANFHEDCIARLAEHLKVSLVKEGRNRFASPDKEISISIAVSKAYLKNRETEYWFSFTPAQREYLSSRPNAYVAYGCGSAAKVVLLPFTEFEPLLDRMWTTSNEQRFYWHIMLHEVAGRMLLGLGSSGERLDVSDKLVPGRPGTR